MDTLVHVTQSEQETIDLGERFAGQLKMGDVVALFGDLGAGKTEFVKGICEHFHVEDIVSSPTFSVINQYSGDSHGEDIKIYHIDLYRIDSPKELSEIGFEECLGATDAIKLVEWAEKATEILPKGHIEVHFGFNDDNEDVRTIEIDSESET